MSTDGLPKQRAAAISLARDLFTKLILKKTDGEDFERVFDGDEQVAAYAATSLLAARIFELVAAKSPNTWEAIAVIEEPWEEESGE